MLLGKWVRDDRVGILARPVVRSGAVRPASVRSVGIVHVPILVFVLVVLIVVSFYFIVKGSVGSGLLLLLLALIAVPTLIVLGLKAITQTGWGRNLVRENPKFEDVTATGVESDLEGLVGKNGMTVTRARPSGMAEIDGRRVDVVAEGMMIDVNKPIEVIGVEGNRVIVRRLETS